jgi:hypothetical protein
MLAKVASVLLTLAACHGPPARLIVGFGDTVLVNNSRPVQLSVQVFDGAGHVLPDTGARFELISGMSIRVSRNGVVTCPRVGDGTLRASLGPLVRTVLLRCRPVHDVLGGGPVNLVMGDPPYDPWFEAVDAAGRRVRPLTAVLTVDDTTIVTREGWRIRARAPGTTGVDVWVGDEWAHWYVRVFEPAATFDSIRVGQHLAVPVRLAGGEQRSWQIPPSRKEFSVQILSGGDTLRAPRLAVLGANCMSRTPWDMPRVPWGYTCLAWHGAAVIAYHPRNVDPAREWSGTVAVVRGDRP